MIDGDPKTLGVAAATANAIGALISELRRYRVIEGRDAVVMFDSLTEETRRHSPQIDWNAYEVIARSVRVALRAEIGKNGESGPTGL